MNLSDCEVILAYCCLNMAVRPHMRKSFEEKYWKDREFQKFGEFCSSIFNAECRVSSFPDVADFMAEWQMLTGVGAHWPDHHPASHFRGVRRLNKPIKWRSIWQQYVI